MGAIRAAVALGSGNVYIFQDQSYRRYEFLTGAAPDAPQDIAAQWSGLSPDAPDAAIHWGGGKVFFFYGATYLRYDLGNDAVDPEYLPPSARRTIAQYWPGLWTDGIDAAVNWGNGKIFFFKAGEYVRYDMTSDRVDDGYPRPIEGNWPGVWTDGIDAVFYQGGAKAYFFRGVTCRQYDVVADQVDREFEVDPQVLDSEQVFEPVPSGMLTAARDHLAPP